MAVLDTTFLVALQQNEERAHAVLEELKAQGEPLRIPAAVWVEFLYGFAPINRSKVARELENAGVFEPFDRPQADAAVRIQHELLAVGLPLSWHDLQIGATAAHFAEPLISNDEAFQRVAGLEVRSH